MIFAKNISAIFAAIVFLCCPHQTTSDDTAGHRIRNNEGSNSLSGLMSGAEHDDAEFLSNLKSKVVAETSEYSAYSNSFGRQELLAVVDKNPLFRTNDHRALPSNECLTDRKKVTLVEFCIQGNDDGPVGQSMC